MSAKNFLWGTATSSHQIEGGNFNNDWYLAEQRKLAPLCGKAANSWVKWREDIAAMKKIGVNAYRFSIEWSRICPSPNKIDYSALKNYKKLLQALHKGYSRNLRGQVSKIRIKSCVTLWHFTNPVWFAKMGGWTKKENIKYFLKYVKIIAKELGQYIDLWCVLNEPNLWALAAYQQGYFPPFEKNIFKALRVQSNLAAAQNKATALIKSLFPEAQVGFALNVSDLQTKNPSFVRNKIKDFVDWIMHFRYLNKVIKNIDWLGINYYYRIYTDESSLSRDAKISTEELLLTGKTQGALIYPKGLYLVLKKYAVFKKPLYVLENGIGYGSDFVRKKYLKDHLFWLKKAMETPHPNPPPQRGEGVKQVYLPQREEGVKQVYLPEGEGGSETGLSPTRGEEVYLPQRAEQKPSPLMGEGRVGVKGVDVRGYFYWSLVDNYEWMLGYRAKFGLFSIDKNFRRKPRSLAKYYAEEIKKSFG